MDDVGKTAVDEIIGEGFGGVDVEGGGLGGGREPLFEEGGFASVGGIVEDQDVLVWLDHITPQSIMLNEFPMCDTFLVIGGVFLGHPVVGLLGRWVFGR